MNEEDAAAAPVRASNNPRQFIAKRQGSNKHFDPFGQFAFITNAAVVMFSPFALSIMVFLRKKLGYRMPKPFLLATVFQWLILLCLAVNVCSYGWFRVKRDTPLGDYLRQMDTQNMLAQLPPAQKPARPDPTKTAPDGFDTVLPANWAHYDPQQRQAWVRLHSIKDPARLRAQAAQRAQEQQAEDSQAQAAQKARQDAIAAVNADAEAEKTRPFIPHVALLIYAVAFLWLGTKRRRQGAALIKQSWHTMSRGVSYLSNYFPKVNEYRMQAFYEPGCVFLLGAAIAVAGLFWEFFSFSLGVWLIVSAVCLSLSEIMLMELALNEALDKSDAEIEARQYSDIRKAIRSSLEQQRVQLTGGIRGAVFDPETAAFLQKNAMQQQEEERTISASAA